MLDPSIPSKRILLVINGTDFGGTESALLQTAVGLAARGRAVHVLSIKPPGHIGERLAEAGVPLSSLRMREVASPLAMLSATRRLGRWLRGQRFDVIHSFLPRANIMSRLANRLAGGRAMHISAERSTDFQRSMLVQALNRATERWTDHVLAVSPIVRNVLIERERVPADKISVLENGIDLRGLDAVPPSPMRAQLQLPTDEPILCCVGRLVPDKGHTYLLQAIARARTPARFHLLLAGDGPEDAALRCEVAQLGLSDRVHFLGFHADVIGLLKGADVFVLPSLEEGLPVTVLEAMACALPVIATDVGGVSTLVIPDRTGILVPPAEVWQSQKGNGSTDNLTSCNHAVQALADAIDQLLSDGDRRRALGRAGRALIEERYTLDRALTLLEEVYAGRAD